ncbi:MAG: F0F1 ATP synthase subunit A [Cyclobacteriaceae bacterium]
MTLFLNKISRFPLALIFVFFGIFSAGLAASAQAENPEEKFNASEVILHHVMDDHVWHFWDGHHGTIFLPVIIYTAERGLDVFSSRHFYDEHHDLVSYNGYKLENNHIFLTESGKEVLDLSITKNVAMLFINAILLLIIFRVVANGYNKNKGKAPKGVQAFMEPVILFVKDEIVRPNIGPKYERYLPYMLTLFFFILFGNILGLLPGGGNLTGNIAITMTLAFFTFIITNFSGNKNYWKHVFWTPGVPLILRIIILPVEIIGLFTKPFALLIRLFAAITAGHIVILSLLSLVFIFHEYWVGGLASVFVVFISLIELLVAAIQAYVFTLFSSLYIGMANEEHNDHHLKEDLL